ncbi:uncharacterized protein LACBIDRAFT_331954 [Laccaria bicolor S238N-H82]|uniref:Predicted protein n=1 Tax=Laccaria bicolor (strain S238N-H82 / ATCC MYA-4686) TaxID=486041 RepID=B0DR55_LACBS|nr:uncharacterized protein LACBIDRAFT_331954 [Laccaria bicolor S238N-H82]EDR03004.1 predicted protein [Laccaria bicolor S238N-H82]|eukprot:XP_001886427.1 predicted protein [Laccaria bicolor S238N-H82]
MWCRCPWAFVLLSMGVLLSWHAGIHVTGLWFVGATLTPWAVGIVNIGGPIAPNICTSSLKQPLLRGAVAPAKLNLENEPNSRAEDLTVIAEPTMPTSDSATGPDSGAEDLVPIIKKPDLHLSSVLPHLPLPHPHLVNSLLYSLHSWQSEVIRNGILKGIEAIESAG